MSYLQIIIEVESSKVEQLSDMFMDYPQVLAVSTTDQYEGTDMEEAIFIEPGIDVNELWQYSKLTILLSINCDIDNLIQNVQSQLGYSFYYKKEMLADQDWVKLTQSQFEPIKITNNFYIVPSWHDTPIGSTTIILDPGLAFGSGSHATTFMCLEWIANNINSSINSVIDYGCGSGILAISAKKFGASKVIATDIDLQAIEATNNNALVNEVTLDIMLPNKIKTKADIVIANILVNPLIKLANILSDLATNTLILSGILANQVDDILCVYQKWFDIRVVNSKDEWVLLLCQKK